MYHCFFIIKPVFFTIYLNFYLLFFIFILEHSMVELLMQSWMYTKHFLILIFLFNNEFNLTYVTFVLCFFNRLWYHVDSNLGNFLIFIFVRGIHAVIVSEKMQGYGWLIDWLIDWLADWLCVCTFTLQG